MGAAGGLLAAIACGNRVGPLNENYNLAFDYEYWVRCFAHGIKVRRLPRVLAQFRRHAGQKSTDSQKAAAEIRSVVNQRLASCDAIGPGRRLVLRNRLAYDAYRSAPGRDEFWRTLACNPEWLLLPEVRARLVSSRKWRTLTGSSR